MILVALKCPYCGSEEVSKCGQTANRDIYARIALVHIKRFMRITHIMDVNLT